MSGLLRRVFVLLASIGPVLILIYAWEMAGRRDSSAAFFFSYPSQVITDLVSGLLHGDLVLEAGYTMLPALAGLVLGALVGGGAGFTLVAAPSLARYLQPLIAGLGALPVFAIAPMTLVWFGLGLSGKVFLAFLGCVFVFLQAAYKGGQSVPKRIVSHMTVHGFSPADEFLKVRLPFAADWLAASFKTGANLALLGVFVGEFVASEHGLARVMLNAGALYNVKRVLAAAMLFMAVAVIFMTVSELIYRLRIPLLRRISVSARIRA